MRLYLPLPLCLSVGAHLAALVLLAQHMGSHGAVARTGTKTQAPARTPHVLQVSLAQPSSSRPATASAAASPSRPQPRLSSSVSPVPAASRGQADAPVASTRTSGVPESMPAAAQPSQRAEAEAGALPEPRYYLLRELSARPVVLEDATPALAFEGVPAQTVILRLFINEEGGIDRVATEQSVLPEAHAQRLIETFTHARFLPGQLDGAPVKSQMRIEVKLESALQRDVSLQ